MYRIVKGGVSQAETAEKRKIECQRRESDENALFTLTTTTISILILDCYVCNFKSTPRWFHIWGLEYSKQPSFRLQRACMGLNLSGLFCCR
ncbi:hypothetical protein Ddye_007449 [Dipteronia dyeriana]|uniref:Uncharacterized protein n=1 Tax=Dipteronia dyeriana TaxID=168575 RepID=A0AAD9XJV0_9ROSI|nr:hypothetical protein Ddye_007449 [Dipteronia dyeriana]